MGIAASLVAQGKKDRALLALKRKKLQARPWARRRRHRGAVHRLNLLNQAMPASGPLPPTLHPHSPFPTYTPHHLPSLNAAGGTAGQAGCIPAECGGDGGFGGLPEGQCRPFLMQLLLMPLAETACRVL